ncbi:MAG TPA: CDP-glucose 4,6-dehydratase [Candidatus Binatia bacterium]|nr:CDP-glucose 4,6-dehydratase [Candidatus Binatia bacterium]
MSSAQIDASFWRDRAVFITGNTGFKGSWLSLWLSELGAAVSGYALEPDTEPSLFAIAGVGDVAETTIGDVRDLGALERSMKAAEPSVAFHLASQPLVRRGLREPVETYSTNVMGTVHFLEAVRRTPSIEAVVVVTSDKCYDNDERSRAFSETEPMGGADPYSSSKGCAELVTAAYRTSYFSDRGTPHVASARAGNVIGGGDWSEDRIVPDIIRAHALGQAVKLRFPDAVRPWQHILDALCGYLVLAQRLHTERAYAEAWNFGPDEDSVVTVSEIAERMSAALGSGARWEIDAQPAAREASTLCLDSSKAKSRLGWRPQLTCERAVEWTAEWYRLWREGLPAKRTTLAQIDRFAH